MGTTLTKTRIAPDLLAGMKDASDKPAALKEPMFDVIVEFNRNFPGGIGTARPTLLSAYEKARKSADLSAIVAGYRAPLAAGSPRDDTDLVASFGQDDTVAVRKSLCTDNYIFATLSAAAIRRLSTWTLSVPNDDPDKPERKVLLVY